MSTESIKEKLQRIASHDSKWKEKADWRKENEGWLDKSAKIALRVLRTLRAKGMSQKDLADKLGISAQQVNKLVKGQENLTLETISRLEVVLGIELSTVPLYNVTTKQTASSEGRPWRRYELKSAGSRVSALREKGIYLAEERVPYALKLA